MSKRFRADRRLQAGQFLRVRFQPLFQLSSHKGDCVTRGCHNARTRTESLHLPRADQLALWMNSLNILGFYLAFVAFYLIIKTCFDIQIAFCKSEFIRDKLYFDTLFRE